MDIRREVMTVLYADDDPDDFLLAQEAFREAGLAVDLRLVENEDDLMDYLRDRGKFQWLESPRPDLILIDPNMSKNRGEEILEDLKNDHNLKQIPIVVLTSSEIEQGIYEDRGVPAAGFLLKPMTSEGLLGILQGARG